MKKSNTFFLGKGLQSWFQIWPQADQYDLWITLYISFIGKLHPIVIKQAAWDPTPFSGWAKLCAEAMKKTLVKCESLAIDEESKLYTMSLESMLELCMMSLGMRNMMVCSTTVKEKNGDDEV